MSSKISPLSKSGKLNLLLRLFVSLSNKKDCLLHCLGSHCFRLRKLICFFAEIKKKLMKSCFFSRLCGGSTWAARKHQPTRLINPMVGSPSWIYAALNHFQDDDMTMWWTEHPMQSVTNIFEYSNIRIYWSKIFIWTFIRIKVSFLNILGHSFVSNLFVQIYSDIHSWVC